MLDTRQIIDYAADDNAKDMRESLYASIYDRVTSAIEAKRQEVGATMFNLPLSTEETVVESKEEDDEHEDEKEDKEMCKDAAKKEVKGHEKRMHGKNEGY
jgi:hypothetical protein